MSKRLSFLQVLAVAFVLAFSIGFAVFILSGATTNAGTSSAIRAERTLILHAERTQCRRYGTYASTSTLRKEGLLTFKPQYNSVVYVPGQHCGTIVIGSPSYQSPSN